MPTLNADLPKHLYGFVRAQFLYDMDQAHFGEFVPAVAFGIASQYGRALSFHVLLEDGAQFAHVPLHAFVTRPCLSAPLSVLQLWNCFGTEVNVIEFKYLRELLVRVKLGPEWHEGRYLCTIDWTDNGFSEAPQQHKDLHLVALESGPLALQPNNRCQFIESSHTTKPFDLDNPPKYKTNTRVWQAEEGFRLTSNDAFFYGVDENAAGE